ASSWSRRKLRSARCMSGLNHCRQRSATAARLARVSPRARWARSWAMTSAASAAAWHASKSTGSTMRGRSAPTTAGPCTRSPRQWPAASRSSGPRPATKRRCWRAARHAASTAPDSHAATSTSAQSMPWTPAMARDGSAEATTSTPGCRDTRSGASPWPTPGRGSAAANSDSGTSAHAPYATRTPKARRTGRRSASTSRTAAVAARLPSTSHRKSVSAPIIKLLDQTAQLIDIGLAELAALAEVRHQRCHAASKQAVKHALALLRDPCLPAQHRRVEVAPAVALGSHRALLQQAVEQGLDGRLGPVALPGQARHHVFGGERVLAPEDFHHHGFGIADRHIDYTCKPKIDYRRKCL